MFEYSTTIPQNLTDNQNRLLYLIDLHTKSSEGNESDEKWIRKPALAVLIYEGVVSNAFDYDYAPQSALIENRRIWINISQEGQSDVEFLREEELLHGLQISSKSYKPIICYQLSPKGRELLKKVPGNDREAVDDFAFKSGSRELLKPVWDGSEYWLHGSFSGHKQTSTITDTEDVSYVSSAYIPQCLRYGGRPTMSNAHRAHESGEAARHNLRDQELDEVITLNSVSVIVAEYIPFGANQIVQLNNNVGSTERVQGGFISPAVDNDAAGTSMELSPELTSVEILDYTLTNHLNFEAEINIPEDPGIVQVETFGISLNAEGTCFYGMQIEAVMERIKDNISLDHLARILVDVQQDSSEIADSVISNYQRDLLNIIFLGDAPNRNKVNLIIANEITPHLTAEEYMDKGEYENELQQVIGDAKAAYDISEHDTLIFGAHGLLVVGPNSRRHEPLLCAYLQFITIDIFLQNYFARLWILNDAISNLNSIIDTSTTDPTALEKVRLGICKLSKDLILLEEILGYVLEALEMMEIPPEPQEQAGRALYGRLEIAGMRNQLIRRSTDVRKNIIGEQRHLDVIRERANVATEARTFELNSVLEQNTKRLCILHDANSESSHSLQILQIIFSGLLAFELLDRLTGDWTVLDTSWMKGFDKHLIRGNMLVWLLISIAMWIFTALVVQKVFIIMNWKKKGITSLKIQVNKKIKTDVLRSFVASKIKTYEERQYESNRTLVKLTYSDGDAKGWGGSSPIVTLEYDRRNSILLRLMIRYNQRKAKKDLAFSAEELKEKLFRELDAIGLFEDDAQDNNDVSTKIAYKSC